VAVEKDRLAPLPPSKEAELDRQITRSNRLRQSTLASAFSGTI